ncbi:MAG: hypothetical protein SPF56_03995 [Bacteroidaceae bacterium]|nr:hypothetical protein [Bacteroidaceae bacterium]
MPALFFQNFHLSGNQNVGKNIIYEWPNKRRKRLGQGAEKRQMTGTKHVFETGKTNICFEKTIDMFFPKYANGRIKTNIRGFVL